MTYRIYISLYSVHSQCVKGSEFRSMRSIMKTILRCTSRVMKRTGRTPRPNEADGV